MLQTLVPRATESVYRNRQTDQSDVRNACVVSVQVKLHVRLNQAKIDRRLEISNR